MNKSPLEPLTSLLPLGTYQHYKGGRYRVLACGYLESTLDKMVVYVQLKEDDSQGAVFIRPYDDFVQLVDIKGKKVVRFSFIK